MGLCIELSLLVHIFSISVVGGGIELFMLRASENAGVTPTGVHSTSTLVLYLVLYSSNTWASYGISVPLLALEALHLLS